MAPKDTGETKWAQALADKVISEYPDRDLYTAAAGISPSGVVHFGNFRDLITSHIVCNELEKKGKKTRLIFSWDNFDRLRKVPAGVPDSFEEHIGKPLSKIPDPEGCHKSYAEHFQAPFMEAMDKLELDIEYEDQTLLYEKGTYDELIFEALREREKIADILLSFMSDKAKGEKGIDPDEYKKNYYPISVYSKFTGKDATKVLSYDGDTTITYLCVESGKEDTVDLSKEHIAKLAWKVDWPMRWKFEDVIFEPGGPDHAAPGSSFDVAKKMSKEVFGYKPPVFVEYKFVGIQGEGSKMSGSKGNAVSPLELLDIYEPGILMWLYTRKAPNQSFELAFNTEIYRQYDEYDKENGNDDVIPFRYAVSFGQIVQWDKSKLKEVLSGLDLKYNDESIDKRLPLAKNWLVKYNPDQTIELRDSINSEYSSGMSDDAKDKVGSLKKELETSDYEDIKSLEELVYSIPKDPSLSEGELKKAQRDFFKDVYNLLIGKDTGPRLGTFLWAVDRKKVLKLLDI